MAQAKRSFAMRAEAARGFFAMLERPFFIVQRGAEGREEERRGRSVTAKIDNGDS
jgi:hypothetical protein